MRLFRARFIQDLNNSIDDNNTILTSNLFYSHHKRLRKFLHYISISCYRNAVTINVIFTIFSDRNYELRRLKTNHKRSSPIFPTLKHRFLKRKDNVTSVSYIFNKTVFLIELIIFNIIRLSLTCLDKNIYFYINVFFYVHVSFSLSCLIHIHLYNLTLY